MEHVKQQASSKRRLKLGDIAEHLQVKKFVVRAWEKELGLAPEGGLYGSEDVELFKKIKQLVLVEQKSIAHVRDIIGARKVTTEEVVVVEVAAHEEVVAATTCETEYHAATMQEEPAEVVVEELLAAPVEAVIYVAECVAVEAAMSMVEEVIAPTVVAAQMASAPAPQEFLAELTFFKQELLRFQELLKA